MLLLWLAASLLCAHGLTWEPVADQSAWKDPHSAEFVTLADDTIVAIGICTGTCPEKQIWTSSNNGVSWTDVSNSVAPLWIARTDASAVRIGSDIVLLGGEDPVSSQALNDVWLSSDIGQTWTQQAASAPWSGRSDPGLVASGNKLVMFAGMSALTGPVADVWSSADLGVTWSQVTPSASFGGRRSFGFTILSDQTILLIGGISDSVPFNNDVWASTNDGATWSLQPTAAGSDKFSPRAYFGCGAFADDSIIVVGGQDMTGSLNDIWIGTDAGQVWTLRASSASFSPRTPNKLEILGGNRAIILAGMMYSGASWQSSKDMWLSSNFITTTTPAASTSTTSTSTSTPFLLLSAGQLYRHFRFVPVTTRAENVEVVQLSEVVLRSGGIHVNMSTATAIAAHPGSNAFPSLWKPSNAIDGMLTTKWADSFKGNLILTFPEPVHADEFYFATAPDLPEYDPCSWRIEGSNDYLFWDVLHDMTIPAGQNCATPTERSTPTPWYSLQQRIWNNGFEVGSTTLSQEFTGTVPGWYLAGNVFFVRSGSAWQTEGYTCRIDAAEGDYFLGLQGPNSVVSQSVTHHTPGATYMLIFQVAKCSDNYAPVLKMTVDGVELMRVVPSSVNFERQTVYYQSSYEYATIAFENDSPPGDRTVFIDQVLIVQATESTTTTSTSTSTTSTSTTRPLEFGFIDFAGDFNVAIHGKVAMFLAECSEALSGYAEPGEGSIICVSVRPGLGRRLHPLQQRHLSDSFIQVDIHSTAAAAASAVTVLQETGLATNSFFTLPYVRHVITSYGTLTTTTSTSTTSTTTTTTTSTSTTSTALYVPLAQTSTTDGLGGWMVAGAGLGLVLVSVIVCLCCVCLRTCREGDCLGCGGCFGCCRRQRKIVAFDDIS
jgi:hypothetical protein